MLTAQLNYLFYDAFVGAVFDENATLVDLVKVVSFLAIITFAVFSLCRPVLKWLVTGPLKSTMWKVVEMEFNRPDKIEHQEMFGVTTKQEYFDKFIVGFWPELMLIMIQHIIGGFFAVPAVSGFGAFSTSVRNSLACLGILTEMGWEIQDLCKMYFYRIFMGKEGEKKFPTIYVVIMSLHHSLTCVMGLPVILNYRNLPEVHRMVCDLQFAGGFMLLFGEITRTLDVTKKNELRIFVFVSFLMLVLTGWTRVIDWFYLVYRILARFIADENWTFLVAGSFVLTLFTMFNVLFMMIPTYKRFVKFVKKLNEYQSLPKDVDAISRRTTMYELQIAAAELAAIETRLDETLLSIFVDREIERRHTFNPAALSRSATLAAASTGISRQSMVAWRDMPSRIKKRAEDNKID